MHLLAPSTLLLPIIVNACPASLTTVDILPLSIFAISSHDLPLYSQRVAPTVMSEQNIGNAVTAGCASLPVWTAWQTSFRGFHDSLDSLKDDYHDTPGGHSAAARDILNESNHLLNIAFKFSLSFLGTSKAIDAEIATLANRASTTIDSAHFTEGRHLSLTKLIAVIHQFYSQDGFSTPLDVQTLIDAVSEFVHHEASDMGPPPPVRVPQSFQSTPITKNSASHMETSTTHKILDEKLEYELKDHLWTADDSFFDHFFPEIPGLPLPQSPFPAEATEAQVVQWFKEYQDQVKVSAHTPVSGITWEASGRRYLKYLDRADPTLRSPDLFTYNRGELKYHTKGLSDFDRALIIQLAGYAREVFRCQPGRRFVHGYTLVNENMRCWVFTRSGGVVSPRLTLTELSDLNTFSRVFYGYLHNPDLGIADVGLPGDDKPMKAIKVDGKELWLGKKVLPHNRDRLQRDHPPDEDEDGGDNSMEVLKSSWRYSERASEGDLLKHATEHGVKGVAIYRVHEDRECVHDILGRVQITGTIPLKRNNSTPTEESESSRSKRKPSSVLAPASRASKRSKASVNPPTTKPLATGSESELREDPQLGLTIPPHLSCMRDAIRGHRSLLTDAGILHRDISINNIMMTDPSHRRPDGFHGFLIDLDLAILVDRKDSSHAPGRTGTHEFLSSDLLNGATDHYFYDDLQSFFFVMIWLVYDHNQGRQLLLWSSSVEGAAAQKTLQALIQKYFNDLLKGFKPMAGLSEIQTVVSKIRNALWPQNVNRPEIERANLELHRDMFYDQIDEAFKEGIRALEDTQVTGGPQV
ncbi:hypothetical protein EDC01DRAFT_732611 [Geopyxis carbonaria]|nr:hypothetical protein EDC01DRAFT_732611 [Geopyxis carbonaria]